MFHNACFRYKVFRKVLKENTQNTRKSGKKSIQAYKCGFTSEGHNLKGIVKTK